VLPGRTDATESQPGIGEGIAVGHVESVVLSGDEWIRTHGQRKSASQQGGLGEVPDIDLVDPLIEPATPSSECVTSVSLPSLFHSASP